MTRFEDCLQHVLQHEGGFVNHPADPGGATNLGCTKSTWESWTGHPCTIDDIRNLRISDVAPLYEEKYWNKARCGDLPAGIDYCVFDTAINSGPGRAVKFLQTAIGVPADGAIGPITLRAIHAADASQVISNYAAERLKFLKELTTWPTFGRGWERRVEEVKRTALLMAAL